MKERIINVQLVEEPILHSRNGQKSVKSGHFGHQRECLHVIHALNLSKALPHESSLITINGAIKFMLSTINPLAVD